MMVLSDGDDGGISDSTGISLESEVEILILGNDIWITEVEKQDRTAVKNKLNTPLVVR